MYGALDFTGEIPFDARRLIMGCFQPIHVMGRDNSDVGRKSEA